MISQYKTVSIVYGGKGRLYAEKLNNRITELSEKERYPIQSKIIMENILTKELLSDVIGLFKQSEICVAFLTADDVIGTEDTKYRFRQNVVFELGMALIQLGRERCILLSDFDVKDALFELPSDMNSLEIRQFSSEDIGRVIDDVVEKILQESRFSVITGKNLDVVPQYNNLLTRDDYYIDYENMFIDDLSKAIETGQNCLQGILNAWYFECKSLPHYDEQCMYLLERLCFLPMLDGSQDIEIFGNRVLDLVSSYKVWDIKYYQDTELLNFVKSLIHSVVEYSMTKLCQGTNTHYPYEKILNDMLTEVVPDRSRCNPLIMLVYYDYLGLLYLRLKDCNDLKDNIVQANNAFKSAMEYVGKVDMSMQIWAGFLYYNLARTYSMLGEINKASEYYKKTILIRERWLKISAFNIKIRNSLSSEYFLVKMSYLEMCEENKLMAMNDIWYEYDKLEIEISAYSDAENGNDPLAKIRMELSRRKKIIDKPELFMSI